MRKKCAVRAWVLDILGVTFMIDADSLGNQKNPLGEPFFFPIVFKAMIIGLYQPVKKIERDQH